MKKHSKLLIELEAVGCICLASYDEHCSHLATNAAANCFDSGNWDFAVKHARTADEYAERAATLRAQRRKPL